jgi:diguanylate cyclase
VSDPAPTRPGRDRLFIGALVATAAALGLVTALLGLGAGSQDAARNLGNVLQIVAPALAAVACVYAGRRNEGHWRLGWYFVGAASATWGIGQVVWTWLETVQGQIQPFPSLADLFYLGSIPLALVGLLLFPSAPATGTGRARTLLDGLIVASSVLFVSWMFVLGPALRDGEGTLWGRSISLAYPVSDVVVITLVIVAYVRCGPAGRVAMGFVAVAFSAFALADSFFTYDDLHDVAVSEISNVAWIAGYLLIALGALHAGRHPADRLPDDPVHEQRNRSAVLLPYVPLVVVLGLAIINALTTDPIIVDSVLFWIGVILITLLLVRQGVVVLENARLAGTLAQSNRQLQYEVLHDTLTGLPNRPLFLDRLRVVLARMSRVDEVLAVMFIDLDRFKPVNDSFGHETGDAVLAGVGARLERTVRAGDTVARFGGDEFLVLCEDVSGVDEARGLAERLVEAVAESLIVDGHRIQVNASIGVVVTDAPAADAEEMIRRADGAMYTAKRKGRNRIELLDDRTVDAADHDGRTAPLGSDRPAPPAGQAAPSGRSLSA